jgi:hypothetical protein
MGLKRELSNPLSEDEAKSLTNDEKAWLRSWNRAGEIPGEDGPKQANTLDPNGTGADGGTEPAGSYDDMGVGDLKDLLKQRELPVSGNKQDLIDRLTADDESDDDEDDDDEDDDDE